MQNILINLIPRLKCFYQCFNSSFTYGLLPLLLEELAQRRATDSASAAERTCVAQVSVLTVVRPVARLASVPDAVVLADAGAVARLALNAGTLCLQSRLLTPPRHSVHGLRWRWCSQRPTLPHSLQLLHTRPWWQYSKPWHSRQPVCGGPCLHVRSTRACVVAKIGRSAERNHQARSNLYTEKLFLAFLLTIYTCRRKHAK